MRSCSAWWLGRVFCWKAAAPFSNSSFLPTVQDRRLEPQFVTEVGDGQFLKQMAPQNGDLLFGGVVLALFFQGFSPLS